MILDELRHNAHDAERLLKALANANRLMILCELHKGERSVAELNAAVPLSQSALSQHLAKLREEGIVTTRRTSQTIHYTMASLEVARIIALLYELYCGPGAASNRENRSFSSAAL